MRQLDFYEFTGIFVPGVVTSVGLCLLVPSLQATVIGKDMSLGSFGLFAILSYAVGHLIQAVGHLVESLWWRAWGGMPSDWVRSRKHPLLSPEQQAALQSHLAAKLSIGEVPDLSGMDAEGWYSICRQVYAALSAASRCARIDTFNGNYGLNRGLVAALAVLIIGSVGLRPPMWWLIVAALALGLGLALWRMHRFGRHYARELLVQFLQLPTTTGKATTA